MFDFIQKPKIAVKFTEGAEIILPAPSKNLYDKMSNIAVNPLEITALTDEILSTADGAVPDDLTEIDRLKIFEEYFKIVYELVRKYSAEIPCYPDEDASKSKYTTVSGLEKVVSEYTGLNFCEIENLNICDYWTFARDAVIYANTGTQAGREYLEKCWIYGQTEPDRQGVAELKEKLEGGRNGGDR